MWNIRKNVPNALSVLGNYDRQYQSNKRKDHFWAETVKCFVTSRSRVDNDLYIILSTYQPHIFSTPSTLHYNSTLLPNPVYYPLLKIERCQWLKYR